MTDDRHEIKPQDLQAYVERAHQLRAEALRDIGAGISKAVKTFVHRIGHAFDIPRIENTKRA